MRNVEGEGRKKEAEKKQIRRETSNLSLAQATVALTAAGSRTIYSRPRHDGLHKRDAGCSRPRHDGYHNNGVGLDLK